MEDKSRPRKATPNNNAINCGATENAQVEVGLSKLQSTLNMLEKSDATNDIAVKALLDNDPSDKHDKGLKSKPKKNQEINDLEENHIIAARLRRESGRVYSSGLMVDSPGVATIPEHITEIQEPNNSINMPVRKQQPCSDSECCKNTAKIVNMIAELQQTVKEIKSANDSQTCKC